MKVHNQFELLRERRFAPFFATQFLGAFNDNVYKNALVTLLAFQSVRGSAADTSTLILLSGALFMLPFFLFSASAGQLADKYEKSRFIRYIKLFEIAIMVLGAVGFYTHHMVLLFGALFLLGVHSTLFGPLKYAIMPQHLRQEELVGGNALVDAGTFIAILLGTILSILLIGAGDIGIALVCAGTIGFAVLGWLTSCAIPHSPPPDPQLVLNRNPFSEIVRNLSFLRSSRSVFMAVLGISWFWFLGATFVAQFPLYARDYLGGDERTYMLLLAVFSIGIGIGSLLCERLSGHKIEIGLVPFGSIGLTVFAFDLYLATPAVAGAAAGVLTYAADPHHWRMLADVLLIGAFGGFYVVPLYALVQSRTDRAHQSRIIAGNNILNALLIVISALLSMVLLRSGFSIPQLFMVTALLNAVVAVYVYAKVPEFMSRFLAWLLIHTIYRLKSSGLDRIPQTGAALLVCNRMSSVAALIITSACGRPIRFVVDRRLMRVPLLGFALRTGNAIATSEEDAHLREKADAELNQALRAGELVCVFSEGHASEGGELLPIDSGISRILERTPATVVPLALRRLPFAKVALAVGEVSEARA